MFLEYCLQRQLKKAKYKLPWCKDAGTSNLTGGATDMLVHVYFPNLLR